MARSPETRHLAQYTLPNGNVQVAFSGGRTSAYMLHQILAANGNLPERCVVSFQNTGREMPETLDFVQECADRWGVHVVWLEWRDFATFGARWEVVNHNSASRIGDPLEPFRLVVRKRRYLPNRVARFCTGELKVHTATRYFRDYLGWKSWQTARGLRADEPKRLPKPGKPNRERWIGWHPLVPAGVTKEIVGEFWRRQAFDLRLPSVNGKTMKGNCDMCFLKSEEALSIVAREHPERAAIWAADEEWASDNLGGGSGVWFNQKRPVRHIIDNASRDLLFEAEGALCQADDGECFG